MYIKSIFLISSFVINLGSVSTLSSDEVIVDLQRSASEQLNDYYKEFNKPVVADEKCNCDSDIQKKSKSLANYYSEFLSK